MRTRFEYNKEYLYLLFVLCKDKVLRFLHLEKPYTYQEMEQAAKALNSPSGFGKKYLEEAESRLRLLNQ